MRLALTTFAFALAVTGAAQAGVIYSNNFDTENGGTSQLNYGAFSGIAVVSGTVDLVHTGDGFGINCAGGPGGCVDLQGSTNQPSRMDLASFAFAADTLYTFSFDLSGDQRNGGADQFYAGVIFDNVYDFHFLRVGGGFGSFDPFTDVSTDIFSRNSTISPSDGFQNYSIGFKSKNAGTATFVIGSTTSGNVGPVADNFLVSSAAIPEPATWALMIGGFGMAGAMMRRRRVITVRA